MMVEFEMKNGGRLALDASLVEGVAYKVDGDGESRVIVYHKMESSTLASDRPYEQFKTFSVEDDYQAALRKIEAARAASSTSEEENVERSRALFEEASRRKTEPKTSAAAALLRVAALRIAVSKIKDAAVDGGPGALGRIAATCANAAETDEMMRAEHEGTAGR